MKFKRFDKVVFSLTKTSFCVTMRHLNRQIQFQCFPYPKTIDNLYLNFVESEISEQLKGLRYVTTNRLLVCICGYLIYEYTFLDTLC